MFGRKKNKTVACDKLEHIAFIMDGNGRWAKARMMPREYGHVEGAANFKKIVRYCGKIGIKAVTVYAFSTENWSRPKSEVDQIMKLLEQYIEDALDTYEKDNLHLVFLGDMSIFPEKIRERIRYVETVSRDKDLILNVALNYGSHAEIANACNLLIAEGKTSVTPEDISSKLYTAHCKDPDLIVRTGGDIRLSNFLLWQAAYSELYFTKTLWPDLSEKEIDEIVENFNKRKRRYGGI